MSDISAKSVMDLRLRTGLGVMECKRALAESDNDIEQAIDYLRRSSKIKTAKKSARVAADGVALTGVNKERSYGVILELNSETDFVARDENFLAFAERLICKATESAAQSIEEVMSSDMEQERQSLIQKVGENIQLRRLHVIKGGKDELIADYTHSNKRIATLLCFSGGNTDLGRDIAMHIAASAPLVVYPEDMPEELVAKEREMYTAQAADSDKPANIVEKMVEGKVRKYLSEHSLVEQPFVKQPDTKVTQLLKDGGAKIREFMRYEVGEGTEKSTVDFAAEVAEQAGLRSKA
jgi:elongation factor Ts